MAVRLPASLSKVALLAAGGVLLTGGITYAAEQQLGATPTPAAGQAVQPEQPAEIVVPDVRRQAFVFAKGALQDAGLAWKVVGRVHGYAANVVVSQSPDAGTRVIDTGAPTITLKLSRNPKYAQHGQPQDLSPYRGTAVRRAGVPAAAAQPAATTTAAATTPAATTATPTTTTPAPAPAATTTAAAKPAPKPAAHAKHPQSRRPAFTVAGAPKEPLDEMPLPNRASALAKWIATNPKPTNANVKYWLYQNSWIVTGAKFGWWRGAEALRILIAADRRTESVWGIGSQSRSVAQRALAEVEARTR
jgi:hypothetical protein